MDSFLRDLRHGKFRTGDKTDMESYRVHYGSGHVSTVQPSLANAASRYGARRQPLHLSPAILVLSPAASRNESQRPLQSNSTPSFNSGIASLDCRTNKLRHLVRRIHTSGFCAQRKPVPLPYLRIQIVPVKQTEVTERGLWVQGDRRSSRFVLVDHENGVGGSMQFESEVPLAEGAA